MRRVSAALAGLSLALVIAGCGDDPEESSAPSGLDEPGDSAVEDAADGADVPEACRIPFPQAFAAADVADLALMPADFPEPPVEATLCITAETVGGANETASYATEASAEEVLAGYESALADFDAVRDQDGIGRPIVTANGGGVTIQVTPQDGGFVLAFAR